MRTTLGDDVASVIFGVDGVIIDSAQTAATTWKSVLDPFLRTYCTVRENAFVPFDVCSDYLRYVHGRPRMEGAHTFLMSRGITLPFDDLRGLAAHEEEFFLAEVRRHGITPFRTTIAWLREAHRRGIRTAAVSADPHSSEILHRAGVYGMFDLVLDGLDAPGTGLPTHAEAALLLQAALRLDVPPRHAVVVEETAAGVAAAQRGGFALVIGVERVGGSALAEHGADTVVGDLSEITLPGLIRTPATH